MSFNVILAGFHEAGRSVLTHLLQRNDIANLAVFTHPQGDPALDLISIASRSGVFVSTERLQVGNLPFRPDIISSVYYRNIIRQEVIDACQGRIFNMHPSLLPRHRGCSAIPWAMIDGDSCTGVTFHYIDAGIDTGRVILQTAVPIYPTDTQEDLYLRCMRRGVAFWPAAFQLVAQGFKGVAQEGVPSYHRRGAPAGGCIDQDWPLDKVERFIRAMVYPPFPYARFRGHEIPSWNAYLDVVNREFTQF